jgi:hypothetical protein
MIGSRWGEVQAEGEAEIQVWKEEDVTREVVVVLFLEHSDVIYSITLVEC